MISSGGVQVSSSLEYVGSDVRFITNHGAFKKLSQLATDKRMPPLPAYQLEAFFISLSGITRNDTAYAYFHEDDVSYFKCCSSSLCSVSTLLYASTSEFKMVYTPPLYCSCHTVHPSSTVSSLVQLQTPATIKHSSSVLATGHSLEANFTSDVMMFIGPDQVRVQSTALQLHVQTYVGCNEVILCMTSCAYYCISSYVNPQAELLNNKCVCVTM